MNECEQTHPLLRGYLDDSLSARDRRLVARHLNLCASARKELDRLKGGGLKSPTTPAHPPSEPLDLKILRWMFKAGSARSKSTADSPKKNRPEKPPFDAASTKRRRPSSLRFILGIVLFFALLVLVAHLVENREGNSFVQNAQRWLNKNGITFLGTASSLEMVQDLTEFQHWAGNDAPIQIPEKQAPYQELISDPQLFQLYWRILEPGLEAPKLDLGKNAVVFVLLGTKTASGYAVRFKVMKDFTDRTVLAYDEVTPVPSNAPPILTRPWVLQVVPKPTQPPVLIQKIQ